MMAPFLICALPRSRTAWCSKFLSYADWTCGHETLITMRSIEDVRAFFARPNIGTVDTPAAPGWELLRHYVPDLRTVVIRRPVEDVVQSFLKLDLRGLFTYPEVPLRAAMTRADRALDRVASQPGVLSIEYADLANEDACRAIWHHCLPYRFDADWWAHWDSVNVQADVAGHLVYYHAHKTDVDGFKGLCMAEMWRLARAGLIGRKSEGNDGITLQQEPLAVFLRDGPALFAEHAKEVGEAPDSYLSKNIALAQTLENNGALQITTARCNGRMFGYLAAVIGPSLEGDWITGTHTLFYASPKFPGLGLKLQRASIDALRARGVGEVFFRAGIRGAASRVGVLFKRLGAEEFGQLYRLDLRNA